MKPIKVGIMSQKEIRARTLAIARGEYKPRPDEPKIWFTSIRPDIRSFNPLLVKRAQDLIADMEIDLDAPLDDKDA